jgi:glutathione S-transferase
VQFPELLNRTSGRQEAKRLTGSFMVPVLVTDDGEVIQESDAIVAWAQENPAAGARPTDASTFPAISKV